MQTGKRFGLSSFVAREPSQVMREKRTLLRIIYFPLAKQAVLFLLFICFFRQQMYVVLCYQNIVKLYVLKFSIQKLFYPIAMKGRVHLHYFNSRNSLQYV